MIDSHLHLWDPAVINYPWLTDVPALRRAFLLTDLDPGDIGGFIVVEAGSRDGATELDWIASLARESTLIRGVVANVPLEHGPAAEVLLRRAAAHPLTVGIRRNLQDESTGFMLAGAMLAGVRMLALHQLPFDACIRRHQMHELIALVDHCPEVTFVLDHLGKPDIAQRRYQPWAEDLAALARRPNVVAKLSGLTTEADHERWRDADVAAYLRHAVDCFGPHRCMFGSDWPVATLATTYRRWVDVVLDVTADLADSERAAIFTTTATRVYRLAPNDVAPDEDNRPMRTQP
jgi:L-fuconolactonase